MTIDRDSEEYHLRSIRCAFVAEALGGMSVDRSTLFARAWDALLEKGLTNEQIIEKAKPYLEGIV